MNDVTIKFIERLKKDKDTIGIILFGSWARGNNRPDSDVDLLVLKKSGFRRKVERAGDQVFEIVYTNPEQASEFWKKNLNDSANFFEVARILYDESGIINKLREEILILISKGRPPLGRDALDQLEFDAADQINYANIISLKEPEKANYILSNKVFALTEVFFQIRGKWTPAPKQRLEEIKKIDSGAYESLMKFYGEKFSIKNKIKEAQKFLNLVFKE